MQQFSSTQAKQSFGVMLEAASHAPIAIEKHGQVRAIVAAPEFYALGSRDEAMRSERRAARMQQAMVDMERLIKHQKIAIALLTVPARDRMSMIQAARKVVSRWAKEGLCSDDYIEKWDALLRLPPREMAKAIVADNDGWGAALRQNSPWVGVAV